MILEPKPLEFSSSFAVFCSGCCSDPNLLAGTELTPDMEGKGGWPRLGDWNLEAFLRNSRSGNWGKGGRGRFWKRPGCPSPAENPNG